MPIFEIYTSVYGSNRHLLSADHLPSSVLYTLVVMVPTQWVFNLIRQTRQLRHRLRGKKLLMHAEETEQFPFPFGTLCSPLWCLCSGKLNQYFIDQKGEEIDVSTRLRSPVHSGFFDIDAGSRFSAVSLVLFKSSWYFPILFVSSCLFLFSSTDHIASVFSAMIISCLPLKFLNYSFLSFRWKQHYPLPQNHL